MMQKFEWDEDKNRTNIAKHGIDFEYASRIFNGFTLDREDTLFEYGETRVISIGCVDGITVLVVVHTDRLGVWRIISARQANMQERALYEDVIQQTPDT